MSIEPLAMPSLSISLDHGDTDDESCCGPPLTLFEEFTLPSLAHPGFGELEVNVSVKIIPDDVEKEWFGSPEAYWMRQKIRRAIKLGYTFQRFEYNDYLDDLYEINTSLSVRQGRAMSSSYMERPMPQMPSPTPSCLRHRNDWLGVFRDGKLYAYALIVQAGEMMLFSMILGHGDHMDDGIMNLLVYESVRMYRAESATQYAVYYLQDSGTEGLQFFKRKMGFAGHRVRWALSRRETQRPGHP
jgi:hypothetical protein